MTDCRISRTISASLLCDPPQTFRAMTERTSDILRSERRAYSLKSVSLPILARGVRHPAPLLPQARPTAEARTPAVRHRLARFHNNTCCCCLLLLSGFLLGTVLSLTGTFASQLGTHSSSASTSLVTLSFAARRAICVSNHRTPRQIFLPHQNSFRRRISPPLRGGRKIRRPIVTAPSRLPRAHADILGFFCNFHFP